MLGQTILTTLAAAAFACAEYLPDSVADSHFRYNLRKRLNNGTDFNGPYSTSGRDIVDGRGTKVTWAGVNWPMSGKSVNYLSFTPPN